MYECRRCGAVLVGDDARAEHRAEYGFGHAGRPVDVMEVDRGDA